MDDDPKKSVPFYGTWPATCDNGLQNSGLNTTVPRAVLTVNGKSYIFGVRPATFISSYVYSLNATSPATQLSCRIYQSRFFSGDVSLWGSETAATNIYLESIYKCRSWESTFTYRLVPGKGDHNDGQVSVLYRNLNSGAIFTNFSGSINVATVTVSGPITPPKTPHIFFFDTHTRETVDATESSQYVAVGQQIQLFAVPAGSGVAQPWEVKDSQGNPPKIVQDYTFPPMPGSGLSDKPANVTPATAATFSNPDTTTFYWVTPGSPSTYDVTYYYTQADGKPGFVEAKFEVDGPIATDKNVTTAPAFPQTNPVNIYSGTLEFATEGVFAKNGITFDENAIPATHNGYFFWTQLVSQHETYDTNGKTFTLASEQTLGLDNAFPFSPACYNNRAVDSPGMKLLPSWSEYHQENFFTMYLMWIPTDSLGATLTNAIPVPLGFVPWYVQADVLQKNGVWVPQFPPLLGRGGAQSLFVPITSRSLPDAAKGFPQRDHVDVNTNSGEEVPSCD
jgi:hypothetical protein